ncbi:MAG: SH3 domain-containing protein [Pararhizobium sp.]
MCHKRIAVATVVAALAFGIVPAFGAECVVADPTGTPLNVRAQPNGHIVSTLDNGLSVDVIAETRASGKRWVQVAADGETLGWVFANFLDCSRRHENPKSAPMHPRTAPE